jgi:hypothetical protein
MNDRHLLPIRFDPERLAADLARLERIEWIDHFVKQNYQGSWSAIPLRAPAGEEHPVRMIYSDPSCREFADTPFLAACPYFREVLAAIEAPLEAVRLMKLAPGSIIREHTDHDLAFEHGMIRLHIPVKTNPGVEFHLNRRRVVMNEGECWYLRLSDPHAVTNGGEADRVHLVIDARPSPWLEAMLMGGGAEPAADGVGATS